MNRLTSFLFRKGTIISLFIIVEIVVSIISFQFAQSIEERSLITRASTIAASFNMSDIQNLQGQYSDITLPDYKVLKNKLENIAKANSDIHFVYLVGLRNNEIFFYLDDELDGSIDNSPPGQIYFEASDGFKDVLIKGDTLIEGPYQDRWGSWVSGIAPIINPETNQPFAAAGIDISSFGYYTRILTIAFVPILLTTILLIIIWIVLNRHIQDMKLLELKSRFVSIVSHDLHSPLRGIIWACQSMLADATIVLSGETKKTVSLIEQSSQQLSNLVTSLLDFSRVEQGAKIAVSPEHVNLKGLLSEIIQIMTLVAQEKHITLSLDTSITDDIIIVCDRAKTKESLSNIISNAIKYSEEGNAVVIQYEEKNDSNVISVVNKGKGIPESEQKHIFNPDFRATNFQKGTLGHGMGLFFAKQLIEAQGGTMTFTSVPNAETIFYITLKK